MIDFEKIQEDLKNLQDLTITQINELEVKENLNYINIIKKYDNSIELDENIINIVLSRDSHYITIHTKNNFFSYSEKTLLNISIHSDFRIYYIDRPSITFYNGEKKEFFEYKGKISQALFNVFCSHGNQIVKELYNYERDKDLVDLEEKLYAIDSFTKRIQGYKNSIIVDKILEKKHIKFKKIINDYSIYVSYWDGNIHIDEISFFMNPSGTYSVTMKHSNGKSVQNNRLSEYNLNEIIFKIASQLLNQTSFKELEDFFKEN